VEVYVLPSPAPFYPLWGAQSRGVTAVAYCRSRAFSVAVADVSVYLGVRTSVHKCSHVFCCMCVMSVSRQFGACTSPTAVYLPSHVVQRKN